MFKSKDGHKYFELFQTRDKIVDITSLHLKILTVVRSALLAEMSGLSYFAIQIQSWFFKTRSKSNHSPKDFANVMSKSK